MASRRLASLAGAAAIVTGSSLVGGQLHDRYFEWFLSKKLDARCYGTLEDLAEERTRRRSPVIPDEFMAELLSAARRMRVAPEKVKLVLVPMAPGPASTGTSVLPGAHGYLVLPDSMALNCLLGGARTVFKTAFPRTNSIPSECDIDPDQQHLTASPADRYGIAHELSHLANEDYLVRWMFQMTSVVSILGMPFVGTRAMGWSLKAATVPAMFAVLPAFFGMKLLSRFQEARADKDAAQNGYARGGLEFWRNQLELGAGRHGISELYLDHPLPSDRLAMMMKYCGYR